MVSQPTVDVCKIVGRCPTQPSSIKLYLTSMLVLEEFDKLTPQSQFDIIFLRKDQTTKVLYLGTTASPKPHSCDFVFERKCSFITAGSSWNGSGSVGKGKGEGRLVVRKLQLCLGPSSIAASLASKYESMVVTAAGENLVLKR